MIQRWIILLCCCLCATGVGAQDNTQAGFVAATNFENIEYPFPVRYISLDIQGEKVRMAFMDAQPVKPNGTVVLLLHGKNFCGAYWRQTARDLTAKGYRVIMPDQVGFGRSSKPAHIQYSFQLLCRNTKAILDTLGVEKTVVLGHSMGGMVATRFALMYPERVAKLVLENPLGLEDWKVKVPWQSVDDWYAGELKQNEASIREYQMKSYYDNKWKPEYEEWAKMQAGWTRNIDYPRIAWNSALTYDMIFTQPVCYEFGNLKMPVLLIIGQRDRTALAKNKAPEAIAATLGNYPVLGRETAAKIPHATLVEIPGVGHLPHIESYPEFIKPLLAFLAE